MSRRFQEIEDRARDDVPGAKAALKRLGEPQRAHVLAWLCMYFDDAGARIAPEASGRRRIALDATEYWLVQVPKRDR